jgi:hypothetical protein
VTWVRLDDTWCDSEAALQAGPMAAWLHVCALSWSNRGLTDGRLPASVVRRLADVPDPMAEAARLVEAGLWEQTDDGYVLVGYAETQPTADKVRRQRAEKRARQERWQSKRRGADASRDASRDASAGRSGDGAPPRPAPKGSGSGAPTRLAQLCEHGKRRVLAADGSSQCTDCDAATAAAARTA